jgi:hypothetical protein
VAKILTRMVSIGVAMRVQRVRLHGTVIRLLNPAAHDQSRRYSNYKRPQ